MITLTEFAGQNWLITPAALAVGEQPPASINDQKWLLVLTGVAIANLQGNSTSQSRNETLSFLPDMAGPQNSGPLNFAIAQYGIPKPAGQNFTIAFSLDGWAPFVSLSSIFDQDESINAGYAVNVWRPNHFATGVDARTHQPINNIFTGVNVDVGVRDTDAFLNRIGYNITLRGTIVFPLNPLILFESNFDSTPVNSLPSTTQAVGTLKSDIITANAPGVKVISPTFPHTDNWVEMNRPLGTGNAAGIQCFFTQSPGEGIYNISLMMFVSSKSNECLPTISFQTAAGGEFLHFDFLPDLHVRIDDVVEATSCTYVRDQPFTIQITLNVTATSSFGQIALSGGGASGVANYTVQPPFYHLSLEFGSVQIFEGFSINAGVTSTGPFDVANILVTYLP